MKPKAGTRTREELEQIIESADTPDLDAEIEQRVERLKDREVIRERIRAGMNQRGTKIRRNAKCPCGSGLKFKKCCLRDMKRAIDEAQNPPTETPEEPETDEN